MTNPTPHGQVPEALVAVPQGLIGAACSAIRNKRDGGKVLEQLRRYSVGDRSQPLAPQQAAPKAAPGMGNSGFDHQTAADFLSGKTVSDEAVRKFVAASRWAHDERAALSATLLAMHGVLTSREAEIALLKKALLEAEAAPQQEAQEPAAYVHVPHYTVEGKVRPVVSFEKYQQDYADGIYSTRIPLYTAPQPAPAPLSEQAAPKAAPVEQDDHQILAITTAYEQGVGKGHQAYNSGKEIANPYDSTYRCDLAWHYGYGEGKEQAQRATKAAPQPAPAPLSEMPYEKRKAIQEGEQISASDAWFKARHEMLDTLDRRNVFRAGFDRGWNAALAAQGGK
ncbi:MAG: hypothetical protein KAY02_07125 [Acidovorax sp.]|nr:hypothetical protein [Acidovorax sp.]